MSNPFGRNKINVKYMILNSLVCRKKISCTVIVLASYFILFETLLLSWFFISTLTILVCMNHTQKYLKNLYRAIMLKMSLDEMA